MVCIRCKNGSEIQLENLGLHYSSVNWVEAGNYEDLSPEQLDR